MDVKAIFDGTRKKELDDINEANKKAEEWQYEDHDNKSLQTYIAEIVQKEVDDIRYVNNLISTKEETLTKRLDDAESALSETKEKNEQLEGLLRLYAATTAKDTEFTSFSLTSSKNDVLTSNSQQDEIFNLLEGFSANLNFTVEDDPNWRASAYSELLFNGAVVSSDRSYTGTVNSDLTVKHRNTLTGKESKTKTIRFVEAVEPGNPTDVDWLRTQNPDSSGILNWSSHFTTLVIAAITQNSNQYGWSNSNIQYTVEYSSASKDWTQVSAPYNLPEMFGNDLQINLRLKYKVYDIIGNSKECIINLGAVTKETAQRQIKQYYIASIVSNNQYHQVTSINASPKDSLTEAFNGSFVFQDTWFKTDYNADFTSSNTIHTAAADFVSTGMQNEQGAYEFRNGTIGENFYVTIQETFRTGWCTVQ